jgi:hypothetical protein
VKAAWVPPTLLSLAWGLVIEVAAYAVMRIRQGLTGPQGDPAAISWSVHSGFFWRVLTVAYGGGIAAFIAFLQVYRRVDSTTRALPPAVAIAGGLLALQSTFFP